MELEMRRIPMEWLLEYAAERRAVVCHGEFFKALPAMDRAALGRWLPSLEYFSHRFVQALMLRAGGCPRESLLLHTFLQHAVLEGAHPELNRKWMRRHDFASNSGRPTLETVALAEEFLWSARYSDPDRQIVHHNIAGEGSAKDFFEAAIPVVAKLGLNDSSYWESHRDDDQHMRMGVHLMTPVTPDSAQGRAYRELVDKTFLAFDRMFTSWHAAACGTMLSGFTADAAV
jgi:hypothetical protein